MSNKRFGISALVAAIFMGAGWVTAADAPAVEMEDMKLVLPKPAYEGTPKGAPPTIKMEPVRKTPREAIKVPKGSVNLALNKKVTPSDDFTVVGKTEFVTDGDKENKGFDGWVEYGAGLTHITIDLEKTQEIWAIVLWHFHKDPRVFKCVIVQISDDKDFAEKVTTVFNNDQTNESGLGVGKDLGYVESNEGKLIETKGVKGRYVRLYSKGNTVDDDNHYTEVEVWGPPAK